MLSAFTPPDGMNDISVNGAVRARMAAGPPSRPAGKNFTSESPRPTAVISSEAVATPGNPGTPSSSDRANTATDRPGLTTNCAPASTTSSTCAGTSTDPERGQRRREDPDRFDPCGGSQGDLDDVDAAGQQGLAEWQGLGRIVNH